MTAADNPPVLSENRAADLLDVPVRRLRKWVKAGELPGRVLPDGAVVLATADLLDWIDETPVLPPVAKSEAHP